MPDGDPWRSRIVEHAEVDPEELAANPANWRRHPKQQAAAVSDVLGRVGWVQELTVNRRSGLLVDGHLRLELALARNEPTVPVRYVDLDEDEERLVLLTLDPLTGMARADSSALDALLTGRPTEGGGALGELIRSMSRQDNGYSHKIVSPVYEPTSETAPAPSELYDTTVTDALLAEIEAANIPDDVRSVLVAAAHRHTVLRFDKLAEFYAHADVEVQRLMEHSALVIVDVDSAIERGFLALHEDVLDLFREDYPGA